MPDVLLSSDSGASRVLTFNRPDALNAFNQDLWYALADALDAAAVDDSVRCLLLTGAGRAFSAGQDLTEIADPQRLQACCCRPRRAVSGQRRSSTPSPGSTQKRRWPAGWLCARSHPRL